MMVVHLEGGRHRTVGVLMMTFMNYDQSYLIRGFD